MDNKRELCKTDMDKIREQFGIGNAELKSITKSLTMETEEIDNTKLKLDIKILENTISSLKIMVIQEQNKYELHRKEGLKILAELKANSLRDSSEIKKMKSENQRLAKIIEEKKIEINYLRDISVNEAKRYQSLVSENNALRKENKFIQDNQNKTMDELHQRQLEIAALNEIIGDLTRKVASYEEEISKKDEIIRNIGKEKLIEVISTISKELIDEQKERERSMEMLEMKEIELENLKKKLDAVERYGEAVKTLMKENESLVKTGLCTTKNKPSTKYSDRNKSNENYKIIAELQKIIKDKDIKISGLQNDVTCNENWIAKSKKELWDVTKELENSTKNIEQMSERLKIFVHQECCGRKDFSFEELS